MEAMCVEKIKLEGLEQEDRKPPERTSVSGDEDKFSSNRAPTVMHRSIARDLAATGAGVLQRALDPRAPLPRGCSGWSEFQGD